MNEEEKKLLTKDLCARLPYEVILNVKGQDGPKLFDFNEELWSLWIEDSRFSINDRGEGDHEGICEIKPYLRSMSSMTEEERKEYNKVMFKSERYEGDYAADVDWLNAHHFDYRHLIEKGLALEASKEMYDLKEK